METTEQERMEMDSSPPRLHFYPLLGERPEPKGMRTPPLRLPGSIPFLWEEAPGKPRRDLSPDPLIFDPSSAAWSGVELPPRLTAGSLRHSLSFGELLCNSPTSFTGGGPREKKLYRKWMLLRWGSKKHKTEVAVNKKNERWDMVLRRMGDVSPSSSSWSASSSSELQPGMKEDGRLERSRSFAVGLSFVFAAHFWDTFYGSVKQLASRRRDRK
ncbi:hypothetical protein HPP92_024616 [Vanilla planifolia]|nr:hypothetical protein HPP92_024616 [Vanilla planifolia]